MNVCQCSNCWVSDICKAYIIRCSRWFRSSRSGSRKDTRRRPSRSRSLSLSLGIRDLWFLPTAITATIPYIIKLMLSTSEQPNEDRAQQKQYKSCYEEDFGQWC